MRINDGTVGLLEVANKILKQPHLHLEPLVLVVVLHHLEKGRSNFRDLLCPSKMQHRRCLARFGVMKRLEESSALHAKARERRALHSLSPHLDP